jgi:hypothetical protein
MEFLAGFGTGLAVGVFLYARHISQSFRLADRERKLLLNKSFVRDGQSRLFAEAIINEGIDTEVKDERPKQPISLISPFRRGLQKKAAELAEQPKVDAGQKLPDNIKNQIVEAANKAKENVA